MAATQVSKSTEVRKRLSHPVIDSDGHTVEFELGVMDCLRTIGGPSIIERCKTERTNIQSIDMTPAIAGNEHIVCSPSTAFRAEISEYFPLLRFL